MWYILRYEKTLICPFLDGGRTAGPPGGPASLRCLYLTPLPNPPGQCTGPDRPRHRRDRGLRRSNHPQCHPRVQYDRADGVDTAVVRPAAHPTYRLQQRPTRAVARPLASESAYLWPPDEPVDVAFGRRGGVCRGADLSARQSRSPPPRPGTPRGTLAAGQTLDHQSRSGVRSKKKTARPADGPRHHAPHGGPWLWC